MKTFMENRTKIDVLEQAAIELNQLKFHMSKCKADILDDQGQVCIQMKREKRERERDRGN